MRTRFALVLMLLALAALACSLPGQATTEPPPVTTEPPETTEAPPETTEPPGLLPAPLIFLRDDGQLWRVATDGTTLTQLTSEADAVTSFDVNPVDGSLAYTTEGNDLIVTDAAGGARTLLLDEPVIAAGDSEGLVNGTLYYPYWSPDGGTLAYGLGGVNLYDAAADTHTLVLPSAPYPDPASPPPGPVQFFYPGPFSPDGTQMVVQFSYYPEAGGLSVLTLGDASLVQLTSPDGIVCCEPSWSTDGLNVYWASPVAGLVAPGMWRADAATGTGVTLIPGVVGTEYALAYLPQQLADGQLYYFYGMTSGGELPTSGVPMEMVRAAPDGVTSRVTLNAGPFRPVGAAWAPDGSGAAIHEGGSGPPAPSGPLLWVPADGSPAMALGVNVIREMHWGQ